MISKRFQHLRKDDRICPRCFHFTFTQKYISFKRCNNCDYEEDLRLDYEKDEYTF